MNRKKIIWGIQPIMPGPKMVKKVTVLINDERRYTKKLDATIQNERPQGD